MKTIEYEKLTITFDKNQPICHISSCENDAVNIIVPRVIDNHLVTSIESEAFKNCMMLESLIFEELESLPAELEPFNTEYKIGNNAFECCISLKTIEIPSFVTHIGTNAFTYCNTLESVFVPDCEIGNYAFSYCQSLKKVNKLNELSYGLFYHCESLKSLPISREVCEIPDEAFNNCYGLVDIFIPKNVKNIDGLAFRSCYNLKKMTFEAPFGWYYKADYKTEYIEIDLEDPYKNAPLFSQMDFDDGVLRFFKY